MMRFSFFFLALAVRGAELSQNARRRPVSASLVSNFRAVDSLSSSDDPPTRIPPKLFLTSKFSSVDALPPDLQKNVQHTLDINHGLEVTWFNDDQCRAYVEEKCKPELFAVLQERDYGPNFSDVCRACFLYNEGGWYADLDVQLEEPFSSFAEASTSFVSVWADSVVRVGKATPQAGILNAVMGVEPKSPIMEGAINAMLKPFSDKYHWGPITLLDGFKTALGPCSVPMEPKMWTDPWVGCGQRVQMYAEINMLQPWTGENEVPMSVRYPASLKDGRSIGFWGLHYGIFRTGKSSRLMGYSRFTACKNSGCNTF